ncbi:amidase [Mytilinidion resinicola]|uniref:amidase n=1 Tax=Mytilinidion resinicola TaxID=574789 RepID=A0A6A6YXK8_9PEZI|nr:amidase [Mytilinidion resinicola]KAF2812645.1 amidase [Mytilinidion resinicola]
MAVKAWQDIASEKKKEQISRIPPEWIISDSQIPPKGTIDLRPYAASSGILTEKELEITGEKHDATSLAAKLADGSFTAIEVVTAFCKRAAVAQQICNCLTEIMFLDALEEAKKLDAHFKETGKTLGTLHGIPMTFKECFHAKGYDASDGYISRCFDPSTYDSYLIQVVHSAGAVVIAKTNVPQTMLVAEAHNNVFGQTKNPVVSHLTCGGSSGGEGSLMAFGGSAIGIGTDVAGSIRIPAAANGVYGFKPSFGLLPMLGYANSNWAGMNTGIPAVCGPLTRSMRDLSLLTRVVREKKPWLADPSIIPHVYEAGTSSRKPVVGVIRQSGLTVHPPIRRAIFEAVAKLKAAGFQVKEFVPPSTFAEIRKVAAELFTIDGMSYAKRELGKAGEPPVPSVNKIGFWDMPRKEPEEVWEWNAKKGALQKQMVDAWQEQGIDVGLCPAGPFTAVKPDDWRIDMYTVWVNVVDFPAVIIPYDTVDPEKDKKYEDFKPISALDAEIQAMCKHLRTP